jgi:hypothetical protein
VGGREALDPLIRFPDDPFQEPHRDATATQAPSDRSDFV